MAANLACPWCNTHNIVVSLEENKINAHTCWKCGMTFDYKRNSENGYATIRHGIDTSVCSMIKVLLPGIKKIIENNPATVILWEDGTKTVAKCQDGDVFDFEKGVLICSLKKLIGNKATNELLNQTEKEKTNISAKKQKQKNCITCQYEKVNYDDYPCDSCLRRYWRDGSLPNWEPWK